MSDDRFDCHKSGEGATVSLWLQGRDDVKNVTLHKTGSRTKNNISQTVNNLKLEKHWSTLESSQLRDYQAKTRGKQLQNKCNSPQ